MPEIPQGGSLARRSIGGEFVIPALAIAFAIYFFVSVADLDWEAKANAVVIGIALLALVAIELVRIGLSLARGEADLRIGELAQPHDLMPRRLALVAITALFIFVIPWLGLTLGLFLLTAALMALLRAGSVRLIVVTSAVIAAAAYLLFIALLNSRLPRGPIEKLLATLF